MTDPQIIEFVTVTQDRKLFDLKDSFELRTDRGYIWLQKSAIWVLRKLKCFARREFVTSVKTVIETNKFMEKIYRQENELLNLYHLQGERLLVGPDEFGELMSLPMHQMLSFHGQYEAFKDGKRRLHNMEITIVPWMKGMLVIPKDLSRRY